MAAVRLHYHTKIHRSLVKGNGDVRVNIYSLIDWMTRNDLCNDTFMCYVIIGPIYQFVRYEMKTKRLVWVDPLKQIRKPKKRFDLKWLNDDADFIM